MQGFLLFTCFLTLILVLAYIFLLRATDFVTSSYKLGPILNLNALSQSLTFFSTIPLCVLTWFHRKTIESSELGVFWLRVAKN